MYTETHLKEITNEDLDEGLNTQFNMKEINPKFMAGKGPMNFKWCQANGKVMQDKDMTSSGYMSVNIKSGATPYLEITQGEDISKVFMVSVSSDNLPFTFSTSVGGGSWFLRIKQV